MAKCKVCGKTFTLIEWVTAFNEECWGCEKKRIQEESRQALESPNEVLDDDNANQLASSGDPNTLGCFYEWILNSTIIFAACAFVISLFSYFTADDPIAEQINMGTLLISGAIVGLLTAVRWLMGAMSTHLANQAQIIELMSKKDGDE